MAITLPNDNDNTTYTLSAETEGSNSAGVKLTPSSGSASAVILQGTSDAVKITENTGTDTITFDLQDDVTIATSLTVNSGGAATRSSFGYQVTIPATPLQDTDAASKGYVDGLVSGGLTFKGTFRADSW